MNVQCNLLATLGQDVTGFLCAIGLKVGLNKYPCTSSTLASFPRRLCMLKEIFDFHSVTTWVEGCFYAECCDLTDLVGNSLLRYNIVYIKLILISLILVNIMACWLTRSHRFKANLTLLA